MWFWNSSVGPRRPFAAQSPVKVAPDLTQIEPLMHNDGQVFSTYTYLMLDMFSCMGIESYVA